MNACSAQSNIHCHVGLIGDCRYYCIASIPIGTLHRNYCLLQILSLSFTNILSLPFLSPLLLCLPLSHPLPPPPLPNMRLVPVHVHIHILCLSSVTFTRYGMKPVPPVTHRSVASLKLPPPPVTAVTAVSQYPPSCFLRVDCNELSLVYHISVILTPHLSKWQHPLNQYSGWKALIRNPAHAMSGVVSCSLVISLYSHNEFSIYRSLSHISPISVSGI